jgi:hypothetical protein
MRRRWLILATILACGCERQAPAPLPTQTRAKPAPAKRSTEYDRFFVDWFKAHGHKEVIVDKDGVGVPDNATRLKASLYKPVDQNKDGCVAEMEFTVRVPSGRQITEFVAGMAKTKHDAINDSMVNFTLTTFHPIYGAFINQHDSHTTLKHIRINQVDREVIMGDIMLRGDASTRSVDLSPMRAQIQETLKSLSLDAEPHWIKVVYAQNKGVPMTVAVTVDNQDQPELTEAVKRLKWPALQTFYMAKEFVVIK